MPGALLFLNSVPCCMSYDILPCHDTSYVLSYTWEMKRFLINTREVLAVTRCNIGIWTLRKAAIFAEVQIRPLKDKGAVSSNNRTLLAIQI